MELEKDYTLSKKRIVRSICIVSGVAFSGDFILPFWMKKLILKQDKDITKLEE